jgi:hypothetical protein
MAGGLEVEDACCPHAAKNGLADRGELSNYDKALQLFHAIECITAPLVVEGKLWNSAEKSWERLELR